MTSLVQELGASALLSMRAWRRSGPRGEWLVQVADLLARTVPLVLVSMGFVGAVLIIDGGIQVKRLFGDPAALGPAVLQLMVREFGPAFGGVVAATRLGAGIASELASLRVGEQIDAMELMGIDPVRELVAPRVRAGLVALFGLCFVSTVSAAWTGAITASVAFGSRPGSFLDTSLVGPADVAIGLVKAAAFGLVIPAWAAQAGLSAAGGSSAVGAATTKGVVGGIVAVVLLDLWIGGAALLLGL